VPRTSPALALLAAALVACGPTSDPGGGPGPDDQQRDASAYTGGDGNPGDPDFTPDAGPCAFETTKAQQLPLDIYVMLDQSASMDNSVTGGTKWSAVTSALKTFLHQPGLTGISVGIQYFGLPASGAPQCTVMDCTQDSDCGPAACGPCYYDYYYGYGYCSGASGEDSCNAADYAHPDVEIAPLDATVIGQLETSIAAHSPTTLTPTSAALQGAIDHAKSWAGFHPGHVTIVIFATDGVPTECNEDQGAIDAIAAAGVSGTPKVLTFVIGVGDSLANLNGVAAAGGTQSAFLVDTTANVNQQFLAALNTIRGAALGCSYTIPSPDGGSADVHKINVQYTPGSGGAARLIPQVPNQAACPLSGDAWYYDDPAAPTKILLCKATCDVVGGDASGQVDIVLGCTTIID
jgi:hypothetical protein